jgi:multidrug resistance protein, MATE family
VHAGKPLFLAYNEKMGQDKYITIISEIRSLLFLALPLMLSEIIDASFSFIATILSARLGIIELAAGGLVTTLFITFMIFMWGILVSVSSLISQCRANKDEAGISRVLKDALILACLFSIPGMFLVWHMAPILLFFGQKPETIAMAEQYLHALTWAVFPDFCSIVFLQFMIGLGKARLALLFNMIKVPMMLIMSFIFMYGKWGPKLGLAGLGWGIVIGMWSATSLLFFYIIFHKDLRKYLFKHSTSKSHYFFKILEIGLPIAAMFCIEIGYFVVMALMMGRISSAMLAANQIVAQFIGFFIVIISFTYAQAVGIRVGYALGRKDLSSTMTTTYAALIIVLGMMMIVACCYWFIPDYFIAIDLNPYEASHQLITHIAIEFMWVAGFVQLFESARIILFGALRGLGQARFSLITSFITFWLIAFPVGYILTFLFNLGGIGMWLGVAVGTLFGAILLFWWLHHSISRNNHFDMTAKYAS